MEPLIQCSGCKKRFAADGFKVTRLHKRLKTCLECNERDALRRQNPAKQLAKPRKRFNAIVEQAELNGWRLINADEYLNGHTKVEWECISCGCIKLATWSLLRVVMKFECSGVFHCAPVLLSVWQEYARTHGLDVKRDMKWSVREQVMQYEQAQRNEREQHAAPPADVVAPALAQPQAQALPSPMVAAATVRPRAAQTIAEEVDEMLELWRAEDEAAGR